MSFVLNSITLSFLYLSLLMSYFTLFFPPSIANAPTLCPLLVFYLFSISSLSLYISPSLTPLPSFILPFPASLINLCSLLPSQQFLMCLLPFWIFLSNYSSSPLYPWNSSRLSLFSLIHLVPSLSAHTHLLPSTSMRASSIYFYYFSSAP